jgi:hypothetical protein
MAPALSYQRFERAALALAALICTEEIACQRCRMIAADRIEAAVQQTSPEAPR